MVAAAFAGVLLAGSGLAIFVAPGAVVLAAASFPLQRGERFAFAFATSLVLLTGAFAGCLALGTSIAAAPAVLGAVTVAAALLLNLVVRGGEVAPPAAASAPLASRLLLVLLTLSAIAAAVAFAPVGSIDRWWYLAYVRGWLDAPVLTLAEPFLGTRQAFARFGVHPWLFGLATWSHLSDVDPVVVYERGAPVLVVLASVSAARVLAVELFGEGPRARLCVIATMLLWSGAAVPLLARAGEDKVLAAAALLPLCVAAFLRVVRGGSASRATMPNAVQAAPFASSLLTLRGAATMPPVPNASPRATAVALLFAAGAATAAVHALAYAFVLVALLPVAALLALRDPSRRRAVAVACAVLVVVAIAPAMSGIVVSTRLSDIGAELSSSDHPVVRVHEGRDRLVELPFGGYVVSPRLLAHPYALLALVALPLLWRRRAVASPHSEQARTLDGSTRAFLVTTLAVPLAIAFVPPLPALAGAVIPPWMVYRVLWLLPLAPLAALAAGQLAGRLARTETAATLLLLVLGIPVVAVGMQARLAEVRERLATPEGQEFRALLDAITALPADALVVAAPELSERLPALTARHVVAALDRSTIVFAGSRLLGEARLRARSALLAGDSDGMDFARAAHVRPTHAVFDPRALAKPRCGAVLQAGGPYALCELAESGDDSAVPATLQALPDTETREVAVFECSDAGPTSHRDPWSAAAPVATCRVSFPTELHSRSDLVLRVDAATGRAVDELRISMKTPGSAEASITVRGSGKAAILLGLPPIHSASLATGIEVRIGSSFLPFVRPVRVALAIKEGVATSKGSGSPPSIAQ